MLLDTRKIENEKAYYQQQRNNKLAKELEELKLQVLQLKQASGGNADIEEIKKDVDKIKKDLPIIKGKLTKLEKKKTGGN